jgi:hypothetical protein
MLQPRSTVIAGLLWLTAASVFAQSAPLTAQPPAAEPAVQQAPADPLAAARRITAAEAKEALAKGEAVLVDVRAKESYDIEHAQGAISLPLSDIPTRSSELPKDKLIVTYCT